MICPQCGTENGPGDKFCEHCGAALPGGAVPEDGAATMVGAPPTSATLVRADDPSQNFSLGTRIVVGRLDSCDIPIHDKSVSREHARLSQLPGGYVVEDLGSTNGTLVNGERITEPVILRPGDSVTFGSIEFRFEEAGGFGVPAGDAMSTQPFVYRSPDQTMAPAGGAAASPEPPTPPPFESSPFPTPAPQPFASTPAAFASQEPEPQSAAPEETPAFEFPPLQPFPSAPEPAQPVEPEAPEPVAPAPAAEERPVEEPAPAPPPVAPVNPPAPEPVATSAVAASEPVAANAPLVPEPVAASAPSVPEPAAPQPTPTDAAPSALPSSTSVVPTSSIADEALSDDAVAAAAHLSNLVHALAQRAATSEARVRDLEDKSATHDALRAALAGIPAASVDTQQLSAIQQMLEQLIQNPRDIEVLMQVGKQASDLSTVVNEYGQLRDALQRVADAAG